jgi:hypothetical protein
MADDAEAKRKVQGILDTLRDLQRLEAMEKGLRKGEPSRAEKYRDEPHLPMAMHGIEAGGHMVRRKQVKA